MSELADKTPSPDVQVLEALIKRIANNEVKVYRSVTATDYLACPGGLTFSTDVSLPPIDSPLSGDDTLSWLTSFGFFECRHLLKGEAVMRMQRVLKTHAMRKQEGTIHDAEALQVLQTEPVVATVVEYMQARNREETTTSQLYDNLTEFINRQRLTFRGRKGFPGGSNVLGKQLKAFKRVFKALGVCVDWKRSDGGKVTLTRVDRTPNQPSAEASADNSNNSNDLSHEDGTSRILAALAARRIKEDSQSRESKK